MIGHQPINKETWKKSVVMGLCVITQSNNETNTPGTKIVFLSNCCNQHQKITYSHIIEHYSLNISDRLIEYPHKVTTQTEGFVPAKYYGTMPWVLFMQNMLMLIVRDLSSTLQMVCLEYMQMTIKLIPEITH